MLEEVTQLVGLQIYTNKGVYLGSISNLILDLSESHVDGFFVESTNPTLVEAGRSVTVPYRWVQSVGDIIVLKHFPEDRVLLTDEEREMLQARGGGVEEGTRETMDIEGGGPRKVPMS